LRHQDDKVELTELFTVPPDRLARKSQVTETSRLQYQLPIAEALMAFDVDKDDRVTEVEAMAAIARAFK
jgi:hypothetical protein